MEGRRPSPLLADRVRPLTAASEHLNWQNLVWLTGSYRESATAVLGTDATFSFQDSLWESGQWNFASWKRPIVSQCSVPIPADRGLSAGACNAAEAVSDSGSIYFRTRPMSVGAQTIRRARLDSQNEYAVLLTGIHTDQAHP